MLDNWMPRGDDIITPPTREQIDRYRGWCSATLGYWCAMKPSALSNAIINLYRENKELLWETAHKKDIYNDSLLMSSSGNIEIEMYVKRMFSAFYGAFEIDDVRQRILKLLSADEPLIKKFVKTGKTDYLNEWILTTSQKKGTNQAVRVSKLKLVAMPAYAFMLVKDEELVHNWDSLSESDRKFFWVIKQSNDDAFGTDHSMSKTFDAIKRQIADRPKNLLERVGLADGAWELIQTIKTVDEITSLHFVLEYCNGEISEKTLMQYQKNATLINAVKKMADVSEENRRELAEACEVEAYSRYATIKSNLTINGFCYGRTITKSDHMNVLMLIYLSRHNTDIALQFQNKDIFEPDHMSTGLTHTSLAMYFSALYFYLTMETIRKSRDFYFENNSETMFSDVVAYRERYEAEHTRAESLAEQLAEARKSAEKYRTAAEAKPIAKTYDEKAYQSELAASQKQNRELVSRIEELEARNKELFALREFAFAVENGDEITEEDATSGGEALNALAKDYRIAVIGGHANWRKKMAVAHPNIEFFDGDNRSVNLSGLYDTDILVMYTEHMSHSVYEKALVSIGEKTKVCFAGRGVNVDKMERDIANAITEKLANG